MLLHFLLFFFFFGSAEKPAVILIFVFLYIVNIFSSGAGVQPQLIQGIRRRDGIGEGQETTA